jgi:uncharacterized phiE125 gp8 family phage protein
LIEAIYDGSLDGEPCGDAMALPIPRPPLISITSVTYTDFSGSPQTWNSSLYQVDAPSGPFAMPGRLAPIPTATWPLAGPGRLNAFVVRFKAGYGTKASQVPNAIRQACLLMIGGWYENREDIVGTGRLEILPMGALALLTPYKVHG